MGPRVIGLAPASIILLVSEGVRSPSGPITIKTDSRFVLPIFDKILLKCSAPSWSDAIKTKSNSLKVDL